MTISAVETLLIHQRTLSDVTEHVLLGRVSQCGLQQQSCVHVHVHVHDIALLMLSY